MSATLVAAIEIVSRFGGAWSLIRWLRVIPRSWRDRLYDLIAGNRYRWFGRHDYCAMPDPKLADRFLGA